MLCPRPPGSRPLRRLREKCGGTPRRREPIRSGRIPGIPVDSRRTGAARAAILTSRPQRSGTAPRSAPRRDDVPGPEAGQAIRGDPRGGRNLVRGAPGGAVRPARSQRSRKDHHHVDALRPAPAGRGTDPVRRNRPGRRADPRQGRAGNRPPGDGALRSNSRRARTCASGEGCTDSRGRRWNGRWIGSSSRSDCRGGRRTRSSPIPEG
jgi:hypothetical protein